MVRSARAMGVAVQHELEPADAVVRRSRVVMVVAGQVEGHGPATCRRRTKCGQRCQGQGSLQSTAHAA